MDEQASHPADPERQRAVEDLFEQARARPHIERDALIDGATDDAWIRAEVRSLLRFDSTTHLTRGASDGPPFEPDACIGLSTGGFTIRRVLGTGGMGTVFEAEQDLPARRIAVKVLHGSTTRASTLARFRKESEFLARLDHPNIARVIAAGSLTVPPDSATRPYFAMELVPRGRSITRWAREESLGLRERVALIVTACDAVGSGHRLGIVHLDLKPGNLLLSETGALRVIDYGIARSIEGDEETAAEGHAFAGTPQYMSPEQFVRGGRVDSSADVYALGLILYELVTGRLPYETRDLPLATVARVVAEHAPVEPRRVDSTIPRALEAIVLKAIAKQPGARYGTASELGDDLRRWLADEPVLAAPSSTAAMVLRLIRRNPVASAFGGLALLAVAAAAIGVGNFALEAERAAESARISAARASLRAAAGALALERAADVTRELDTVGPVFRGWEARHMEARLANIELYCTAPSEVMSVAEIAATGEVAAGVTGPQIIVVDRSGGRPAEQYDIREFVAPGASTVYSIDATADGREIVGALSNGQIAVIDRETRTIRVASNGGGRHLKVVDRTIIAGDYGGGVSCIDLDSLATRGAIAGSGAGVDFSFSRDGSIALAVKSDGSLRCFDIDAANAVITERWVTAARTGGSRAAAVSPDGSTMAVSWWDGRVSRLDPRTGAIVAEADLPGGGVFDLAISPDNSLAAASSWSSEIRMIDLTTLEIVARYGGTLTHVWGIAFSADGSRLFGRLQRPDPAASPLQIDCVGAWTVGGGRAIRDIELGTNLTAARSAGDGRFIACDGDGVLSLVDVAAGTDRQVARLPAPARRFAWSSGMVAAGLQDGSVAIVPHRDGVFEEPRIIRAAMPGDVRCLEFSPDGGRLACASGGTDVAMMDPIAGEVLWRARIPQGDAEAGRHQVNRAIFLDGGKRVTFIARIAGEPRQDFDVATGVNLTPRNREQTQESLDGFLHPADGRIYAIGISGDIYEHEELRCIQRPSASRSGGMICCDGIGQRAFAGCRDGVTRVLGFEPVEILMQLDSPAGEPIAVGFDDARDELTIATTRGSFRAWCGRGVSMPPVPSEANDMVTLGGTRLHTLQEPARR